VNASDGESQREAIDASVWSFAVDLDSARPALLAPAGSVSTLARRDQRAMRRCGDQRRAAKVDEPVDHLARCVDLGAAVAGEPALQTGHLIGMPEL